MITRFRAMHEFLMPATLNLLHEVKWMFGDVERLMGPERSIGATSDTTETKELSAEDVKVLRLRIEGLDKRLEELKGKLDAVEAARE